MDFIKIFISPDTLDGEVGEEGGGEEGGREGKGEEGAGGEGEGGDFISNRLDFSFLFQTDAPTVEKIKPLVLYFKPTVLRFFISN